MYRCKFVLPCVLALLPAACTVSPVTTETTPPTIMVQVVDDLNNFQNTQLKPDGLMQVNQNFDVAITASGSDPGGMLNLVGSVQFYSTSCASGVTVNGYFDPMDSFTQTATPLSNGQVPTVLLYQHEYKTADVTKLPCMGGSGNTSGIGTIVVTLTANNQSNRQAVGHFYIRVGNGALPQS